MNTNDQPLNLLAPNNAQVLNENSADNCDGAHQPLISQLGDQRQMALANLFSSLTSLANNQQPMTLHQFHHQQQPPTTSNKQQQPNNPHQQTPTSSTMALSSSLQSVMAAAMMQQQLVTAVSQHQQPAQQPPASIYLTGDQSNFFAQNEMQVGGSQQQMQQRINYCTICNKELCNKYFMKTHMLKMHGINLEMEQPENESGDKDDDDGGDSSERVGDEDSDDGQGQCSSNGNTADEPQTMLHQSSESPSKNNIWSPVNNKKSQSNSTKKTSGQSNNNKRQVSSTSTAKSQATSVMNGFAGNSMGGVVCDICNKELCSKYFLKVHKQNTHGIMTDYQDANQFMYPFASPMTGPNPFLAPATLASGLAPTSSFPPNPLTLFAAQQPHQRFDEPSVSKNSNSSKRIRLSQNIKQSTSPPLVNIDKSDGRTLELANGKNNNKQFESVYRLILAQQQREQQNQQQQQQPPQTTTLPTLASATVPLPPVMPMDPISASPLGALMCFGAMGPPGPFGPAGMSPAMIVDNILRNQQLFNRNNNNTAGGSMGQQAGPATKIDRNNNNSKIDVKQSNSKTSKDSTNCNNRYFSHYTEACPMCDRRFKSIKWLKTHMMNDHKQEIGAYMQMMMQYLYTSKSQQMATAVTMAALEHQQQQQQQQRHQDLINHFAKDQLQHNQSTSLLNNCFNPSAYHQQPTILIDQKQSNSFQHIQKQQPKIKNRESSPSEFIGRQSQLGDQTDFAVDARCRQESLSPGERLNRQPSVSPLSRSHLGHGLMENHLICGLNFDLDHRVGRPEGFLLSRSSLANSDILGENTGDSDRSREGGATQRESPNQSTQQIQIKTTTG